MVSFRSLTALLAASVVAASPYQRREAAPVAALERRQVTCLLNPAVGQAVACIVGAASQGGTSEDLLAAVGECVAGLSTQAIVSSPSSTPFGY